MKKYFLLALVTSTLNLSAQERADDTVTVSFLSDKSFYVEFLGQSSTGWSLNFENVITESSSSFYTLGVGFGTYSIAYYDLRGFNIPVMLNALFSKKSHHFEVGTGVAINYAKDKYESRAEYLRLLGSLRFGYRYQSPGGGIMVRLAVTPPIPLLYFFDNRSDSFLKDIDLVLHYVGVSLGYTFKSK